LQRTATSLIQYFQARHFHSLIFKIDGKDAIDQEAMKSVLIQSMTLESGVGVGVQTEGESKERVESLEKDLAYYRQTNKDLKQKLREFVMVHEKQMQALERAKERRLKLKSENEQLAKALDELKVAYISVENFINVLDFA
jgi:hypothetical protein